MAGARIPLSALRVAQGKVGITLDVADCDPVSGIVDADQLETAVSEVDQLLTKAIGTRWDIRTHILVRRKSLEELKSKDNARIQSAMLPILWLALNHPLDSDQMRGGMSNLLREKGRAHLTVTVDRRRCWAFSLADKFVDATKILDVFSPGSIAVYSNGKAQPKEKFQ